MLEALGVTFLYPKGLDKAMVEAGCCQCIFKLSVQNSNQIRYLVPVTLACDRDTPPPEWLHRLSNTKP